MIRRILIALALSLILISCVRRAPHRESDYMDWSSTPWVEALIEEAKATVLPEASPTTQPTQTSAPTSTAVVTQPAVTGTPQPELTSHFIVQPGTPVGMPNSVQHEADCSYTGLGGQAFGPEASPLSGLIVEVGGMLNGEEIQKTAITGGSPSFGPGGFEITLQDELIASQGTLHAQLFDLDGNSMSDQIPFDTFTDCNRNLILINFTAASNVKPGGKQVYLPYISNQKK